MTQGVNSLVDRVGPTGGSTLTRSETAEVIGNHPLVTNRAAEATYMELGLARVHSSRSGVLRLTGATAATSGAVAGVRPRWGTGYGVRKKELETATASCGRGEHREVLGNGPR